MPICACVCEYMRVCVGMYMHKRVYVFWFNINTYIINEHPPGLVCKLHMPNTPTQFLSPSCAPPALNLTYTPLSLSLSLQLSLSPAPPIALQPCLLCVRVCLCVCCGWQHLSLANVRCSQLATGLPRSQCQLSNGLNQHHPCCTTPSQQTPRPINSTVRRKYSMFWVPVCGACVDAKFVTIKCAWPKKAKKGAIGDIFIERL